MHLKHTNKRKSQHFLQFDPFNSTPWLTYTNCTKPHHWHCQAQLDEGVGTVAEQPGKKTHAEHEELPARGTGSRSWWKPGEQTSSFTRKLFHLHITAGIRMSGRHCLHDSYIRPKSSTSRSSTHLFHMYIFFPPQKVGHICLKIVLSSKSRLLNHQNVQDIHCWTCWTIYKHNKCC